MAQKGMKIDNVVLNAGILKYPNVSCARRTKTGVGFADFSCREPPKCKVVFV